MGKMNQPFLVLILLAPLKNGKRRARQRNHVEARILPVIAPIEELVQPER
jgi:hypothetical protein